MIGAHGSKPRQLYELTGLLHWYGYSARAAGVQRVVEKIGACAVPQAATQRAPEIPCTVDFVLESRFRGAIVRRQQLQDEIDLGQEWRADHGSSRRRKLLP